LDELLSHSLAVVEAPNTVDSPGLRAVLHEVDQCGGRVAMREMLDVRQDPQLVVLGRLIPEKRVGAAIEAALAAIGMNGLVHVIGDGPDRGAIAAWQGGSARDRIRWWGPVTDDLQLMRILVAANALISAGTLGLSAVHAMFAGLPVIACRNKTTGPWHGPEVEYLDEAGGVWWCSSSTAAALGILAQELLTQRTALENAGRVNRTYAERALTLDVQVSGIVRAIEVALAR